MSRADEVSADEITLPIKRTDGETLEERMTANAYHNILPARYLRVDEDGNHVEEQEELFERVASNIALAEAVYEATDRGIEVTVTPAQLKPDHPRRDDLAAEVFGAGTTVDDDVETVLTEDNVNKFAYETVVPELPLEVRQHVETVKSEFQDLMEQLSFVPNSPTLMNAGDELQQLSACFVDSPDDDIDDIHQTAKEAAQVFQCLTDDARVAVEGKGVVSIADVEPGDDVVQRDGTAHRTRSVEEIHAYDDAPTRRVVTEGGVSIRGTPNHRLLVDGEWTELDDVEPGDTLSLRLGWLTDEDETDPFTAVDTGGQWAENRTVSNEAIAELHATGLSDYRIADELDSSASTVQRRRANELDLPANGDGGRKPGVSFDEEAFATLHEDGYSDREIATELGVHPATAQQYRTAQGLEANGRPVKTVSQPDRLTTDLAELLGIWVGDGSVHQDGIRFHVNRDDVLNHVDTLARRLFDTGIDYTWNEGCYEAVIHSHEVKRWWLAHFGDAKSSSAEARVPDPIWKADYERVHAFLRGLFSTDGTLTKGRYPRFYSSSEQLVDETLQLLLGTSVPATKWEWENEDRDYFSVAPTDAVGLERFAECVGYVDARSAEMTMSLSETPPGAMQCGTVVDEYTWEQTVEMVEDAGTTTVYDVTVTDNHEYVANSVVSHNSGGGMGYAFWRLRPYGDTVGSTGGIASGPITFMRTYDQMCETIAQGGTRRGAQMGVMKVSHPDVIQFIHAKNKDVSLAESLRLNDPDDYTHTSFKDALEEARELIDDQGRVPKHLRNAAEGHLSNFNISVGVTDGFMEALYNEEEFTFTNPRTGEPHVATEHTEELYDCFGLGEYVEVGEELRMPASALWERIIEGAHENGEPGVIYLERVNQEHSFDVEAHPDHEILATNPCLHGNMEVAVADGRESVPIAEIASEEGSVPVYTLTEDGELTIRDAEAFKTKENADLVEVETDGSTILKLTPDHKVRTRNRGWIEAADLRPGDSLEILTKYDAPLGAVIGGDADGTKYRWLNTGRRSNQAEHRAIAAYDGQEIDGKVIHHENHDSLDNRPENLTAMSKEDHDDLHDISGERNPLHILKKRGEFEAFRERNSFYDVEGENNPMYGRPNQWAGVVEWECTRDECSEMLELAPAEAQNRKYCSRECADKTREPHVEFECKNCGETVVAHGSGANKRKYCTRACAAEDTLDGEAKEAFLRHLFVDNPMQREEVKERKVANTDYEAVGESISETRREKTESGELEVEMQDYGPVTCRECGEQFGAVTNTHLNSAHNMSIEDYKEQYPDDRLHGKRPVVTENHEVVSVTPIDSTDVYDLSVPETHNFYAGLNIRENSDNRKDVFVNVHNCGEQPLEEYEACNLGHINLSTLAGMDAPDWRVWHDEHGEEYDDLEAAVDAFLSEAIDFEEFDHRIEWGTRFLENVVTMSDFPIDQIERKVSEMRKIGLGVMGLAQLYIQLGVRYGSEAGNEIARQLMIHINHGSKWTSNELAEVRSSFDEWDNSKYADPTDYREWFEHQTGLSADEWAEGFPIRNHNTTTIAPTGTTSMVGNTTGGCEPIYNVAYYKNVSDDVQGDEMLVEFDDYFLRTLEANGLDVEAVKEEAEEQMATNEFDGVEGLETVPDAIGELFVITADLTGKQHAAVQCACQEGVDSAISKTCNFPNSATQEDMDEVYRYIYDNGGKGVTVYRDGTRSKQVLTTRADNAAFADEGEAAEAVLEQIDEHFGGVEEFLSHEAVSERALADVEDLVETEVQYAEKRARPDALQGVSQRIDTGYGKLYVTINEDPETGRPFELFANIGHSGGFTNSFTEALAKTISTALRSGVDPEEVVDELKGTRSPKVAWDKGEQINSIPDAIGTALRRYLDDELDKPYPKQQTLEESTDEELEPEVEPEADDVTRSLIEAGESPECPDCGSMSLYFSEGCKTCESCGWSECS